MRLQHSYSIRVPPDVAVSLYATLTFLVLLHVKGKLQPRQKILCKNRLSPLKDVFKTVVFW